VGGEAAGRVVSSSDPAAHTEEAISDAVRRPCTRDLSGCVLVSTTWSCPKCETAAHWAGISRVVTSEALTDLGPSR